MSKEKMHQNKLEKMIAYNQRVKRAQQIKENMNYLKLSQVNINRARRLLQITQYFDLESKEVNKRGLELFCYFKRLPYALIKSLFFIPYVCLFIPLLIFLDLGLFLANWSLYLLCCGKWICEYIVNEILLGDFNYFPIIKILNCGNKRVDVSACDISSETTKKIIEKDRAESGDSVSADENESPPNLNPVIPKVSESEPKFLPIIELPCDPNYSYLTMFDYKIWTQLSKANHFLKLQASTNRSLKLGLNGSFLCSYCGCNRIINTKTKLLPVENILNEVKTLFDTPEYITLKAWFENKLQDFGLEAPKEFIKLEKGKVFLVCGKLTSAKQKAGEALALEELSQYTQLHRSCGICNYPIKPK